MWQIARRGFTRLAKRGGSFTPSTSLTTREREVAVLLADGLTNKEIASHMQIEPGTVKSHVHNVIRKFGVRRRAQVVARIRDGALADIHAP